jgi:UDP-N-acetylmuramoyl-tripeptide--D-alanyl-D-alanine ligase
MTTFFPLFLFALSFWLLARKRLKRYLRFFQQENYESKRFISWIWKNRLFDRRMSLVCIFAFPLVFFSSPLALLASSAAFFTFYLLEPNPEKRGKLPLKMTKRATRILTLASLLFLSVFVFALFIPLLFLLPFSLCLSQTLFFFLPLSNLLLFPFEKRTQNHFYKEAKKTIAKDAPFVIGITGSYGKTSTKHLVGELLSFTRGLTFWTEGGINTLMGTTEQVLTRYKKHTEYFVNEMAAHYRGSIATLCAFTPPDAAIITGVGEAHLERFGSQKEIFEAKSELAAHVKRDGILVLNSDDPYCRKMKDLYPKKIVRTYGFNPEHSPDFLLNTFSQGEKGTTFFFTWQGSFYKGFVPLFGKVHLYNVAAALTLVCTLGADIYACLAFLASFAPVSNRLEVRKEAGVSYIHDAYNSNPKGFEAALCVLKSLPAERRFCLTPGFIELGSKQYEHNVEIGKKMGAVCDVCIIVGKHNKQALAEGITSEAHLSEVYFAKDREEAFSLLKQNVKKGDAVLIENDLPDLYEHKERF